MRWSRKGSLEIGVNTIVILVIAMVLLGLGVGFIKQMFERAGDTTDLINPEGLENPPTPGNPMIITPREFALKQGQTKSIVVGVYNKNNADLTGTLAISSCAGPSGSAVPTVQAIEAKIPSGEARGFKAIIKAADNQATGTYLCGVTFGADPNQLSTQFIVEVTA